MTGVLLDDTILLNFMLKLGFKIIPLILITIVTNLFILTLLSTQTGPSFAEEGNLNLPSTTINPGSFYYPFKRLWEKGLERVQFSKQSKINFLKSQLRTRLAELNYVVEKKLLSEVQTSSERFAYYVGILTEELVRENKNKEQTIKEFDQFSKLLEKLRDNYPANTSFWMLIQHDINTLRILSDQLK